MERSLIFGRNTQLARFTRTVSLAGLACAPLHHAQATDSLLYSFTGIGRGTTGDGPYSDVVTDGSGDLFTFTTAGGAGTEVNAGGCGTVVMLSPDGNNSTYLAHVLHNFGAKLKGGINPYYGPLAQDSDGNLYGTTVGGGPANAGLVYKLRNPARSGAWQESTVFAFKNNGTDPVSPYGSVVLDAQGRLFGMGAAGGSQGDGAVYMLTPPNGGSGRWSLQVIHSFANDPDGADPIQTPMIDGAGNLYGMTSGGGNGAGTVFMMTPPNGNNHWGYTVLYRFTDGADGGIPEGGLIADPSGNLYGTTSVGGGQADIGTVFELSPNGQGGWNFTTLWQFLGNGTDGFFPTGTLYRDPATGALWGTTAQGGGSADYGTVFKLTPPNGGAGWTLTTVHHFAGGPTDGAAPYGALTPGPNNTLIGTTLDGGAVGIGYGTVFSVSQ